jgi:hypothetical protein
MIELDESYHSLSVNHSNHSSDNYLEVNYFRKSPYSIDD